MFARIGHALQRLWLRRLSRGFAGDSRTGIGGQIAIDGPVAGATRERRCDRSQRGDPYPTRKHDHALLHPDAKLGPARKDAVRQFFKFELKFYLHPSGLRIASAATFARWRYSPSPASALRARKEGHDQGLRSTRPA